jgi:hypothetical protein
MKRITALLLTAFFLATPLPAIADDGDYYYNSQNPYLRNAEEYRWKASNLEDTWRQLGYRQQWVVSELIDIYYKLAETKVDLADAVSMADWNREELLEIQYFTLKAEESQLWDEFERLKK